MEPYLSDRQSAHELRKEAQLRVCLGNDVQVGTVSAGFDRYRFVHQSLPEIDWSEIDLSINLLGKRLRAPIVISAMTGGCRLGADINRNLAIAAQRLGLGMGVGSQRAAIVDSTIAYSYQVREYAPDILLFANLGAVQLNNGFGLAECRQAVDMIDADGLCLHLNGLQEIFQNRGDCNYRGLIERISDVCERLGAPVLVKEVGWGISKETAGSLASVGVSAIDVAGSGGTSWYLVEQLVAGRPREEAIRSPFATWGIPTVDSLIQVVERVGNLPVIASGGIRNGVDAAKALALGATTVGIALPLLKPATESAEAVVEKLEQIVFELRTAMFCIGAASIADLQRTPHLKRC